MKKYLLLLLPLLMVVALVSTGHSWTMNGIQPGATGSATPIAVGTSTPVAVVTCATSLYNGAAHAATLNIDFAVKGGTSGTDGCYVAPAGLASPCAAASPAPNSSTGVGYFVPTGGASSWNHLAINYPSTGGGAILSSEWDAVCTAGSMTMSITTLP